MIRLLTILFCFSSLGICAQGTFAPPAGQAGTTAIHKDSSSIVDWASNCEVTRGLMDVTDTSQGYANFGTTSDATGASDGTILSLGDNGQATLTFNGLLYDGPGADFAVFENSFSDDFLELAFVEVSSDGNNFFRFPATSTTPDTVQIDGFGSVDATHLNNLAGKYRAQYGTPFDLAELDGTIGLDVNAISHVRVIDCIGFIDSAYATFDQFGHPINDPFPTPFGSGGFDLESVAAIHILPSTAIAEAEQTVVLWPNPTNDMIYINGGSTDYIEVYDLNGRLVVSSQSTPVDVSTLESGQYLLVAHMGNNPIRHPFMKQ